MEDSSSGEEKSSPVSKEGGYPDDFFFSGSEQFEDVDSRGQQGEGCSMITASSANSTVSNTTQHRLSRGQSRRDLKELGDVAVRCSRPAKALESVVEEEIGPLGDSSSSEANDEGGRRFFSKRRRYGLIEKLDQKEQLMTQTARDTSERNHKHDLLLRRSLEVAARGRLVMVR